MSEVSVVRLMLHTPGKGFLYAQRSEQESTATGKWGFPGGKTEGQPTVKAVEDELCEELGLHDVSGSYVFSQANTAGRTTYVEDFLYGRTGSEELTTQLGQEVSDVAWLTEDDLERYDVAFHNDEAHRFHHRCMRDERRLRQAMAVNLSYQLTGSLSERCFADKPYSETPPSRFAWYSHDKQGAWMQRHGLAEAVSP